MDLFVQDNVVYSLVEANEGLQHIDQLNFAFSTALDCFILTILYK